MDSDSQNVLARQEGLRWDSYTRRQGCMWFRVWGARLWHNEHQFCPRITHFISACSENYVLHIVSTGFVPPPHTHTHTVIQAVIVSMNVYLIDLPYKIKIKQTLPDQTKSKC